MTTLECEPIPISLAPSVALTVNSICRPSCYLRLSGNQASNRRCREMTHIDGRTDCALAGIEIDIEGGVFHDHDHHRSGKHRGQHCVLEPVREMLGLNEKVEGALGSQGYLPHGLSSNDRGNEPEVPNFFPELGNRDQSLAELRLT